MARLSFLLGDKMPETRYSLAEIEAALVNDEFVYYYQPKVSFITGEICGAEALIRWHTHDGAVIEPDRFIPLAEESGLITRITMHMFSRLLTDLRLIHDVNPGLRVAFNASTTNYTANEDMFQAISTARQAMMRITSDLRTATAVADAEPATQCSLRGEDRDAATENRDVTYQFDPGTNTLNLIVNEGPAPGTYVLCRNVTGMTFDRTIVPGSNPVAVKSVVITMTVTVDGKSQTVSSAALIRRNLAP